jgi:Kef-type K+ transport system membrane component KefB/nucleotide-binding universal stress UspA family protein
MAHEAAVVVFITQIVALLIAGRLMGELMQRVHQPPVIGQILAGVLLGPSVLGYLAPSVYHGLFPAGVEAKAMLDAVAQLGILLLLLMTGMETDLSVFRTARRPALSISIAGIVVPFACGVTLGIFLPESLLPGPQQRLITTLFLGTALSICSVKIVALVVRDLGFVRRTVGQVIIAASILDDTIGWLIVSVIFSLAVRGRIDFAAVTGSLLGTVFFLTLSFTIGRRVVYQVIRWSNDSLTSEMATVTTIVVIAGLMALLTNAIGVHLVLGAFIAGVLIGQAPMLTTRVDAQLRGLIVALFMPVFFALAGLSTDLGALAKPQLLLLTGTLIVLASAGKFIGAFVGGRVGGLSYAESFAVGCGMNARGSTEIIVASIGLSLGALSESLFTAIVAMAVVTTMAMPPMLRWALARLPVGAAEQARIEREELEGRGLFGELERMLVAVDASPSGEFASHLGGLLAGVRRVPATVLHLDAPGGTAALNETSAERANAAARAGAATGDEAAADAADRVVITTRSGEPDACENAIAAEAKKGYDLLLLGREPAASGGEFDLQITRSAARFSGAFAIVVARGSHRAASPGGRLNILVPVSGTRVSRQAAELAVALTQASHGSLTALYLGSSRSSMPWHRRVGRAVAPPNTGVAALRDVRELAAPYGVTVDSQVRRGGNAQNAILEELCTHGHDLLVMGVTPRASDQLFFGELAAAMLARAPCSLLFVSVDPATPADTSAA